MADTHGGSRALSTTSSQVAAWDRRGGLQVRRAVCPGGTLCPEGLAAEVALEGLLTGVGTQVHVEVCFLCEGMMAELTDIGTLVPESRGKAAEPQAAPVGELPPASLSV